MSGSKVRSFGIRAETALKTILEGAGAIVMRTSMSHGPFDLLALGIDDIALIEVKAISGRRYYPSKSPGTVDAVKELERIATACADNVFAVIAVYFGEIDDFRFFTPGRIAEGPVGPDDADLVLEIRPIASCPPKPSSPPTTYPPRSDEGARASEDEPPLVPPSTWCAECPKTEEARGACEADAITCPNVPRPKVTPAMREAADTV